MPRSTLYLRLDEVIVMYLSCYSINFGVDPIVNMKICEFNETTILNST